MSASAKDPYATRILRVVQYIQTHLDGDLSVERLSEVAGFSKYHFHRLFSAYTGTTVARLARDLRLKQAAYQLALRPEKKVIEIALEAGFQNPETFARAFRGAHGQSPSEFRAAPRWRDWKTLRFPSSPVETHMKPTLKTMETVNVAVLEHRGPPDAVMHTVTRFVEWRKQSQASPVNETRTFGIIYDDPDATEPEKFRFDVCAELKRPLEPNDFGVVEKSIPGGRVAVQRHLGSYETIGDVVRDMYRSWLPTSGEELRDFPRFFEYLKRMPEVSEHEQVTDIYLPLR